VSVATGTTVADSPDEQAATVKRMRPAKN
jgi:hypothetical protein